MLIVQFSKASILFCWKSLEFPIKWCSSYYCFIWIFAAILLTESIFAEVDGDYYNINIEWMMFNPNIWHVKSIKQNNSNDCSNFLHDNCISIIFWHILRIIEWKATNDWTKAVHIIFQRNELFELLENWRTYFLYPFPQCFLKILWMTAKGTAVTNSGMNWVHCIQCK